MEGFAIEVLISVHDYFRGEEKSEVEASVSEWCGAGDGGGESADNEIVGNLYTQLREHTQKSGGKCRAFIENVKAYPVSGAMNLFSAAGGDDAPAVGELEARGFPGLRGRSGVSEPGAEDDTG
jgi:hypothetical protein